MSRIVSSLPGRIRVRDKTLRNLERLARVERALGGVRGVHNVQTNTGAGSVVLHFDPKQVDVAKLEGEVDAVIDAVLAAPARAPGQRSLRVQVNRYAKMGMIGSLATSLALAATGQKRGHAVSGAIFVACLGVHLGVHRRHLLR
ncbi:HMA2 domain-containing protein [Thauera sinica]|uniref:HMA2 domain-containing protein n=1 Tax=Thauera sinica TaxID=2665146 RepID=A0ABW1AXH4_9RHOO|nr:cation transporter [Thauera sp. K11]ATE61081.1 hypothetical protein CCZ27_15065 [Thauera sp. K11]